MKGIILAGGTGSRLWPTTRVVSKQLLPVFDKPMIYYPLSTLMLAGIREILVITTPHEQSQFRELLGTGSQWGIQIEFETQQRPDGLAQAFLIGQAFLNSNPAMLVLGDNLFFGPGIPELLQRSVSQIKTTGGAQIFGYQVADPERYGVATIRYDGSVISIEEKPKIPRSNWAVTGLYLYDADVCDRAAKLRPSDRNELEITDLNRSYLDDGKLTLHRMGRGYAWLDTGTPESLAEATSFVGSLQRRQGLRIAMPEEIAWRNGWIGNAELALLVERLGQSGYGRCLAELLDPAK